MSFEIYFNIKVDLDDVFGVRVPSVPNGIAAVNEF